MTICAGGSGYRLIEATPITINFFRQYQLKDLWHVVSEYRGKKLFSYNKLIRRSIRLKFGMWLQWNLVSAIKNVWQRVCLLVATPFGSYFGYYQLIYVPIMLKFAIFTPSNLVSVINYILKMAMGVLFHSHSQGIFWQPKANLSPTQAEICHMYYK